jgi:tetratricopeptide (TPR) repeat protein
VSEHEQPPQSQSALEAQLQRLRQAELIRVHASQPELEYIFKHALVQEATYHSTLIKSRRVLHRQVAEVIETLFADRLSEFYGILADHCERGELYDKAIDYLDKASAQALQGSAYREAQLFLQRALKLLPKLETTADESSAWAAARIRLTQQLGQAHAGLSEYADAQTQYETSLMLARACGEVMGMIEALNGLSGVAFARGAFDEARHHAEQALLLARPSGNQRQLAEALRRLGDALRNHDYASAKAHYEGSLAICQALHDRGGIAVCLNNLGIIASLQGAYAEAQTLFAEGLAIRRAMGDRAGCAGSLSNLGVVARRQGRYAEARTLYAESLAIRQEIGDRWGMAACLNNLGLMASQQGAYAEASDSLKRSLALSKEIGDWHGMSMALATLGEALLAYGDDAEAKRYFRQSLAISAQQRINPLSLACLTGLAELYLRGSMTERALELMGVILQHPASENVSKQRVTSLLDALKAKGTTAEVDATLARGRTLDLEAVAQHELSDIL